MHLAIAFLAASYVLITPADTFTHGSFTHEEVQVIRDVYGPRVFFFRNDEAAYVVFDQKALSELRQILGTKQSASSRAIEKKLFTVTKQWIRSGVAKPLTH